MIDTAKHLVQLDMLNNNDDSLFQQSFGSRSNSRGCKPRASRVEKHLLIRPKEYDGLPFWSGSCGILTEMSIVMLGME